MRKVKIKLTHAELIELYSDLFNNVHAIDSGNYAFRLMATVLTKFYMKLAPKCQFHYAGKKPLTIEVDAACALMIWIYKQERNAADFRDNLYIKIAGIIDQKLA